MQLLQTKAFSGSKKLMYTGALLILTFYACKKESGYNLSQATEMSEEARLSSNLGITSIPSARVYFMDGKDLYSITHLDVAKPTITKKWTMDTKYDEYFNDNINAGSSTYAYNFKTNEIFSLDYNSNDNNIPYLFKSSTNKNLVTETKTTVPLIGGGLQHIRINPADGKVFYIAGGGIFKMDANGGNNQTVVPKSSEAFILETDIDFKNQLFYYVHFNLPTSSLNVCGVNGQNNKVLISSPFAENMVASQVRLDQKSGKIYFSTKSDTKKQVHIWSISVSGDKNTLKKEFEKSYTDTWSEEFTFDIIPSLNKIVWSLHERLPSGNLLKDFSTLGRLNLSTGVSDILYQGANINCTIAVNP